MWLRKFLRLIERKHEVSPRVLPMRMQRYFPVDDILIVLEFHAQAERALRQRQERVRVRPHWRSQSGDWLRRLANFVDPPQPQT